MVLLLRKLYVYFTKDPEGVHHFPGGGVQLFSKGGGPNANFYRNPYTYLLFSRGGVRTPYPPLDPHMGNVIITGQYLSQSRFRHWFVRINDRWGFPNDALVLRTLTPSRNTDLGSGSFCNSAFFSSPKYPLPQRSESNNIGDWLTQSKKDGKDQESIQSSTTPDPGY